MVTLIKKCGCYIDKVYHMNFEIKQKLDIFFDQSRTKSVAEINSVLICIKMDLRFGITN